MPRTPKRVKANTLTRFFDGDESKAEMLRGSLIGKEMRRRAGDGRVVADNQLDEIKGRPPKMPQPSDLPDVQSPPRLSDEEVEAAGLAAIVKFQAEIEDADAGAGSSK